MNILDKKKQKNTFIYIISICLIVISVYIIGSEHIFLRKWEMSFSKVISKGFIDISNDDGKLVVRPFYLDLDKKLEITFVNNSSVTKSDISVAFEEYPEGELRIIRVPYKETGSFIVKNDKGSRVKHYISLANPNGGELVGQLKIEYID